MTARPSHAPQVPAFNLVQAAQRFLLDALPLRDPETSDALREFCNVLPASGFDRMAAEAIAINVVRKLGSRSGVGADTLVNEYFRLEETAPLPERVRMCVENLLRGRGVRHRAVAAALTLLEARCADSHLRLESIARELQVSPSHLAHLISLHTGERFRAHLRQARMRIATRRLRASANIREIAAAVGYVHVADFNHHFKSQFGMTPTVYRARIVAAGDPARSLPAVDGKKTMAKALSAVASAPTVLIVEDDPTTRDTFGFILRDAGYVVETAESPQSARSLLRSIRPAAIIVDRWIGAVDTIAFACELGRAFASRRVALLTGDFSLEEESGAALSASGVRVAFKPIDCGELVDLVRALA